MAKYAILEGPIAVTGGEAYKVKLIPEVESESDFSEIQEYLVIEGQVAEDVLSAAALNHEAGIVKLIEEPQEGLEDPVEEVQAKDLKDIPVELQPESLKQ